MRRTLTTAFLFFGLLSISSNGNAQTVTQSGTYPFVHSTKGTDDYVPGRVYVKVKPLFRSSCGSQAIHHPSVEQAFSSLGVHKIQKVFPTVKQPAELVNSLGQRLVDLTLTYQLDFSASHDVFEAADLLAQSGIFEYVEPAYVYQPLYTPNDPNISAQYFLPITQAFDAWDIQKGDTSVVIGIIDTGTSFQHQEMQGSHLLNYNDTIDGLDNDSDGYIDNFRGWDVAGDNWYSPGDNDPSFCCSAVATDHGVIVAGPAVARTDNNYMGAGIAYNCRQLAVKTSIDESPTIYNGYQGVVYAADHGAHILNLSWGGTTRSRFGEDAINYALINKQLMVVAAAGNTPAELAFYPASFDGVISCAGSQDADLFWNSTATFGTTYHYMVDINAPSKDIPTCYNHSSWGMFTGTSLGAPIVCAIGALVKSQFPNLTMAQVAQKVRVTADQGIYGLNPASYAERMGRGRVNAYRALTDNSPSVRITEVQYDDNNDGLIQVGDTVSVRVRFTNYLDAVSNLGIVMSTPNWGQFEVIHDEVYAGNLGTMDTVSTWLAPFKLVIRSGTAAGFLGYLRFEFTGTGYSDWEYYPLRVQPNYVHIDQNRIETTMTGTGRWGYTSFPSLSTGKGLILDGVGGMMKDAGFMVGTDATHVSNNFENTTGNSMDNHFTNVVPISRSMPGVHAPLEARTVYSDAGAGANALGVVVDQRTYQWDVNPHADYYIQEYRIANPTGSTLTDVYAGMYMNLEMFWRSNNVSRYDTVSRSIYQDTEEWVSLWKVGASLLTPDSLRAYAAHEDTFSYSIADKFLALSSPPQAANRFNQKVVQFIGSGPFNIAPGDTHIVAFAVVLGDSLSDYRNVIDEAYVRYWCLVRGGMTARVDLGGDVRDCNGNAGPLLDAGAGFSSYEWTTPAGVSSNQTVTASTSGEYWVRVTDANGCTDEDRVTVTLNPGLVGSFSSSPAQVFVGDTMTFVDNTSGSVEWGWDFGDGSNLCPITDTVQHVFSSPGTYQVTLYVGNGLCVDTVTYSVVVDTVVGVDNGLSGMASMTVFPNPSEGSFRVKVDGAGAEFQLSVLDVLGREVQHRQQQSSTPDSGIEVMLPPTAKGIYLVKLKADGIELVKRIVVR